MMNKIRAHVAIVAGAFCVFGFATSSFAQQIEISIYTDGAGSFEGDFTAYVDLQDQTDLSQWGPLVYHYNYSGSISVTATTGSDGDSGSGTGTFIASVPWPAEGVDGDGDIEAVLWFTCSSAGPLQGAPPPDPFIWTSFKYQYVYTSQVGVDTYQYIRHDTGLNNKCRRSTVYHWQQDDDLELYGHLLDIPYTPINWCGGKCRLGWVGSESSISGSSPGNFYCPPTGSDNFD